MVGITLTQVQIRSVPPEVRHWIEQQVAALFASPAEEARPVLHPLAACTLEEAHAVLEQVLAKTAREFHRLPQALPA